ncbi:Tubulin/FtsZ family, GTPase domain-containing protein [Zopfochytrium polystomum]|nr:Tubulin/FtsZ family, GTPase domain-containing protein [Zopfochytrium polystomum]
MVDMEPNVLSQIERSPLGSLFDTHQSMHPTSSGSGNNFSVGYHVYGSEYLSVVIESIRREVEACDALQTFFMLHSLGGGTGSGFGARLVESLEEIYPEAYRFSTVLCPSTRGAEDVVTSPYNAILSLHKLISAADCILPIANDALLDTISKAALQSKGFSHSRLPSSSLISNPGCTQFSAFNSMNNIVANLLANVTASMRFEGTMNIDIGDVVTNLVPFPACRFIVGGMSPIVETGNSAGLAVAGKRFKKVDIFVPQELLVNSVLQVRPDFFGFLCK